MIPPAVTAPAQYKGRMRRESATAPSRSAARCPAGRIFGYAAAECLISGTGTYTPALRAHMMEPFFGPMITPTPNSSGEISAETDAASIGARKPSFRNVLPTL